MSGVTTKQDNGQTRPVVSLLAGGIAGGVEGFITFPIEFAKTRLQLRSQSSVKPPRNPFKAVKLLYNEDGLRAMYKGCGALVIGSIGKDALRFLSFDMIKSAFKDPETGALSPARNMLAGMSAGLLASLCIVTPTERLKTALIDDARSAKRYQSSTHAIRMIVKEDGLVGMYRGLVGTTLKQATATSVRMGTYNIIKEYERARDVPQTTAINFLNGAVAGFITVFTTQPFDTLKTRSQSANVTTTVEAMKAVFLEDGVRGFWRGSVMRLGRVFFSGGILFTVYEQTARVLNPMFAP